MPHRFFLRSFCAASTSLLMIAAAPPLSLAAPTTVPAGERPAAASGEPIATTTHAAGADASTGATAIDLHALLGDPPAIDSPAQRQDMAAVLQAQKTRTPQQIKQCRLEVKMTPFIFASVLGSRFNPDDLPKTAALLKSVTDAAKMAGSAAKALWNRPRPAETNSDVKPCVKPENTPSYPSGHATRAFAWATVLAEIFPRQKQALESRAGDIAQDRVIAGEHYPTDIAAGKKLGMEIASRLLADAHFRADLDEAKKECGRVE